MTETIENSSKQANNSGNLTEKCVFDKGTPTYLRMIEMIKNIAKSKIKPSQNETLQQKQGCNKNQAIEIEDTPEQWPSSEKRGNQGNNQNVFVFEGQCEPQYIDKTQQDEGEEEAEVVDQNEMEQVGYQDQVYQLQQEQQKQENNQFVQEDQAEQDDQQYQKVKPKVKRNAIKSKPEKQDKNVPHARKTIPKESKPSINKSNIQIKPRHSSRMKLHQIIPHKSIPKIQPKSKRQSSSRPLLKTINNCKKTNFQDRFQQNRITINFVVEQLSTKEIQAFNSKSMKKPNAITKQSLNERKQQKKIQYKPLKQKLKKPWIEQQDFIIFIPLSVISTNESKENDKKSKNTSKKPLQKQHFTPKMLIFKSKEMQHKAHIKQKNNLGSYSLLELVQQVFTLGFISEQTCSLFVQNSSKTYTKDFLSKFQSGKLRKFDFKKIKFTPLDHRRMSQLLVNLYPKKYRLDLSYLPQDESAQFIRSSYGLSPKEYFNIYSQIDKISDIYWWSEIIINHKERIHEMVRGKRNGDIDKGGILKAGVKALSNKLDDIPRKRVKFL